MKTQIRNRLGAVTLATLATAALGGCVVAPNPYYYSSGVSADVRVAPPPDRDEVVGVAPFFGAVWIPGRWLWRDHWVWGHGYWARPPRHGARWHRGRWERGHDHDWRWRRGRWDDD